MLNEQKVKPTLLGSDEKYKSDVWYLDTGVSNHMTGCRDKFIELDGAVKDTVKFGDGLIVDICGHRMVLFKW